MHAGHRRKSRLPVNDVIVDAQPMHVAAYADLFGPDDWNVIFCLTGDDAGIAANTSRRIDNHRPLIGVVSMGWIKRRRIGPGLAEFEIALAQIRQREARLQLFGFTLKSKKMLRAQNIRVSSCPGDASVGDGPRGLRLPQPIDVEAYIVAHRTGCSAAVAKRRCDYTGCLTGPHQDWRFEYEQAGCEPDNIAIDNLEGMRIDFGNMQSVTPHLFGEGLGTFLQPGVVGKAAIEHGGIG